MATKKTGSAAKGPKKAAAKKAAPAAKKPKGQTVSSGVSKAKTVGSAGPSNASAGGGKSNRKTKTRAVGGTPSFSSQGGAPKVKTPGGTGATARGAKGYAHAGGTNATGGGP